MRRGHLFCFFPLQNNCNLLRRPGSRGRVTNGITMWQHGTQDRAQADDSKSMHVVSVHIHQLLTVGNLCAHDYPRDNVGYARDHSRHAQKQKNNFCM